MSLINRMLDDLAARQAPGAESLSGVRLSDPMSGAQASLNSRKRSVLIAIALGAAAVVWFLWPKPAQIPDARPRVAVDGVVAPPEAPTAITPSLQPGAPTAPAAIAVDEAAPQPFRPSLQLVPSLGPSSRMDARAARIEDRGDELATSVDGNAGAPAPAAPRRQSATSIATAPGPVTRSERRNPRASHEDSAPSRPAADAPAPVGAVTTQPASRTDAARDALSRGDPAAALEALEPVGSDRDVETASLRAAALQRLGRHVEAADAYRGLTQGDPTEPGHWVGLAISLEGQQKRDEARIAYRRALQSPQLAPSLRAFAQSRVTELEGP